MNWAPPARSRRTTRLEDGLDFGILFYPTSYGIAPTDLGSWAERAGFESVFVPEHSHIPHPPPEGLPGHFADWFDPFVSLAFIAASTRSLRLGTAICLMPEHHPILLAKTVATLDRLSGGRFTLGIGGGWNARELENYGVQMRDRWPTSFERLNAMRRIWRDEPAEFHGDHVDFGPIVSRAKPMELHGPPVLLGVGAPGHGTGMRAPDVPVRTPPWFAKAVVEHCDGWIPSRRPQDAPYEDLEEAVDAIRREAAAIGRPVKSLDLTVIDMSADPMQQRPRFDGDLERVRRFASIGFNRVLFAIEPGAPTEQWSVMEQYRALKDDYQNEHNRGSGERSPFGANR
jgi:probable F420-dependent oxidoreductase